MDFHDQSKESQVYKVHYTLYGIKQFDLFIVLDPDEGT